MSLSELERTWTREIYDIIGLLGDLGGISDILILIFGFFALPVSAFSYNLKVLEKLYLVRTYDSTLTEVKSTVKKNKKNKFKSKKIGIPDELTGTDVVKEVELHYPIKLSFWNTMKLFIMEQFGWMWC